MFRLKILFCHLLACLGIVFILSTSSASVFAETKTFIKEYTYQASEDDSRNSSRVIALREVKRLLLEELGTYLESETEVKNFQLTRDQITTLTAGIVQTEIVMEKWDGNVYWLKAKITADAGKVAQSINELRKDREKTRDLEVVRRKSEELLRENERLRKELASAKGESRETQKEAYNKSINELSSMDWLEKGYALNRRGDFKGAKKAYGRAIELDPKNAMAYYGHAIMSDEKEAMRDFNALLALQPKDSESHLARARTYKQLEKYDLALQEFGKAIDKASGIKEKADAYFARGVFYDVTAMGKQESVNLAILDYNKAIELDSKDSEKYNFRAGAYIFLGRCDLAIADSNKAIELNPKDGFNYSLRAICLKQDSPELAISDYNRAIETDPKQYGFYKDRGTLYAKLGKKDLALKDYSKYLELAPDAVFMYNMRADLYAEIGRHDLALKDYNKTIELKPNSQSAYMDRGEYFAKYDKHAQAIKDYTKAIKLDPGLEPYVKRGWSYFKLGKFNLAHKDYNTAIALNYQYPGTVYYNRAMLYVQENNSAKAIQDLAKAIQTDEYYKRAAQKETQFDYLRKHPDFIKLIGE
jgi:tetratricopeptide (TPR) repeat protein